jgi:CheY-specific phosphatase CheX
LKLSGEVMAGILPWEGGMVVMEPPASARKEVMAVMAGGRMSDLAKVVRASISETGRMVLAG